MKPDDFSALRCAVCEKDTENVPGVTHIYHEGRRFALCCPMCLDLFQREPARFASGERPQRIVEELIEKLKWKGSDRW